jgi:hypothetical protein
MPDKAKDDIIFIRDGTILPQMLSVTTDAFVPNWQKLLGEKNETNTSVDFLFRCFARLGSDT